MALKLITNRIVPGPYDYVDFNRVSSAVLDLRARLVADGYIVPEVAVQTTWSRNDVWRQTPMERYLTSVNAVANVLRPATAEIPPTMRHLTYIGANGIEQALADVDLSLLNAEVHYCGEFFAGEV